MRLCLRPRRVKKRHAGAEAPEKAGANAAPGGRQTLTALDPGSASAVLERDPERQQLVPDRVGTLPVLVAARLLALVHERQDRGVPGLGLGSPPEQAEDATEPEQ